jgi:predicted MFS family arabinose efflux permease
MNSCILAETIGFRSMEPQPEHETNSVSLSAYSRLLQQNKNFRRLWMAQIVSEIGDWFYSLAIYSLLLQLTGRASSVALALVLQVLPWTFVGPAAGVVNDRVRRKHVMITADLVRMVVVLAMLLVRSRSVVWLVYPLLLLETIMAAFFEPARNSVIPNITAREDVILANTLASSTWSVNLMIGAALGGLVAAFLGRNAVFVVNAVSFLLSALLIRGMQFDEPHAAAARPLRAGDLFDFSPLIEGVRYVRGDARLLATILVKTGLLVIGPSWVLFTVMGQRYFPVRWNGIDAQRGAMLGMSLLMTARGLGALLGPLVSASVAGHRQARLRTGILLGFLADAGGYVALAVAPNVWFACITVVLAHFGGSVVWVFSTTLLQLNTEDRFRGRVFAADAGLSMFTIAVGAFVAGAFLDRGISARMVAAVAGVSMLLPAAAWFRALRLWDRNTSMVAVDTAG